MGVLLALGFAARGKTLAARGFAAAALPVLLTTLYFTYSRGGWMALAVGLVFFLVVGRAPAPVPDDALVLALPAAAAVWLASQSHALTALTASYQTMRDDGRTLALELVVLVLVSAALAIALEIVGANVTVTRSVRIGYAIALVLVAVSLVGAARRPVRRARPRSPARRTTRSKALRRARRPQAT